MSNPMTSPTTSADAAAKIASEMREWATGEGCFDDGIGEGKPMLMVWQSQESYLALAARIAALVQHAEAGAVALESLPPNAPRNHTEREDAEEAYTLTAFNYEANPVGSRDWTIYWRGWWHRAVIHPVSHPAQPASQQGEKCGLCDNTGDIHDPTGEWRGTCPNCPHPTGDKVLGLVEKWRASAADAKRYSTTEYEDGFASAESACATELAAALDQEKNDGR